ncbi:MAG: exo-alpha-sialidase [Clostridia bacterium]|nr:exo-alpha-sialidase [Clostridia bacterium]
MLKKLKFCLLGLLSTLLILSVGGIVSEKSASAAGVDVDWNEYVLEHGTASRDFSDPSYTNPPTVFNWYTMDEEDKRPKYKDNREFTAIPAIAVTGERMWCAWMIGGDCEPHIENCLAVGYSDDGGLTWVEPVLIFDFTGELSGEARLTDPLFVFEDNRLFLLWTQNHETQTNYQCVWRTEILNFNDEKETVTAKTPTFSCYGNFWKITVLSDGTWAASIQCHGVKWALGFYIVSDDYGTSWKYRGYADKPAEYSAHNEASIVERADGSLWMTKRIQWQSKQGMEESYSYDGGYTWTDFAFTEYPLKGPGSKFCFIYTRSGNLVMINHDTIEDRKLMTAFISKDEGRTWESSKLLLDERMGVSYPAVALDKDGNIIVVYDMGRETNREIRVAKINEADIFAGRIVTAGNYIKGLVSIGSDNIDLVKADEDYRETEVYLGTGVGTLRENFPSTIHATDYYGTKYEFVGIWDFSSVDLKTVGIYEAVFKPSAGLPENVVDVRKVLTGTVIVKAVENVAISAVSGLEAKTFKVGTHIGEIRKALPEKLELTDADGGKHTVYGYWTSETYEDKVGEYEFTFQIVSELSTYIVDSGKLLKTKVTIKAAEKGCGSSVSVMSGVFLLPFIGFVFLKKRRAER